MGRQIKGEFDVDAPGASDEDVAPSDSTDLPNGPCRAIYFGSDGNVRVTLVRSGSSRLYKNVKAGTMLPLRVKRVHLTDTTATDMIAVY